MDNLRQIHNITRNNFNKIENHCSLATELNLDVFIIINTNATTMAISNQIYAVVTAHMKNRTYFSC